MRIASLIRRSLAYRWRTNVAVVLSVVAGSAALTGALIVGDSMRGSLTALAVGRFGEFDHALIAPRFFGDALADGIAKSPEFKKQFGGIAPVILLPAAARHAESGAIAGQASVIGVDERFWRAGGFGDLPGSDTSSSRRVVLNRALADELGAAVGDRVLLRIANAGNVHAETLLGRREQTATTLSVEVSAVIGADGLGGFSLSPQQQFPRNAFVPLSTLQEALEQPARANVLAVAAKSRDEAAAQASELQSILSGAVNLADYGLQIRAEGNLVIESDTALILPLVEAAVRSAAREINATPAGVLTYLANEIAVVGKPDGASIPYSTVSGVEFDASTPGWSLVDDSPAPALGERDVLLNTWAADRLGAAVGDRVRLTYFVTGPRGTLSTEQSEFTLRGIVPLAGLTGDSSLTPSYPGITDTDRMSDWDPPIPVDLKRVGDEDEAYWEAHKATPKAFVALRTAQELWTQADARFGQLTSIRLLPMDAGNESRSVESFENALRRRLTPERMGMVFEPVRQQAVAAGAGSTDFGQLFLGFSGFVIISAALLVFIVFRLGAERRGREIGLLLAVGYRPGRVARMLIAEGAVLAVIGCALGTGGAIGYAQLMIAGLNSWWSAAIGPQFLELYVGGTSVAIGFVSSFVIALISIALAIRGLSRRSPSALIAGRLAVRERGPSRRAVRVQRVIAIVLLVLGTALIVASWLDAIPAAGAFFGGGAALLTAALFALSAALRGEREARITPGGLADVRLGMRNARRSPGRSVATVSLIASATFVIVAVAANKRDVGGGDLSKRGGTGGFALVAQTAAPIVPDLNTADGRDALNVPPDAPELRDVSLMPFRIRRGDDTSCLNLYQPGRPSVIGATPDMINRGGFTFASTLAESDAERANPWELLDRSFEDGAIPAIGDADAVMWQLHLGLGKDLVVQDDRGEDVTLRFVALLSSSILQSEVVVSEGRFIEMYPATTGYGFFLIDAPRVRAENVQAFLEDELSEFGFDAASAAERLAEYRAVPNTYLSTFQALGGLGLLIGTFGVAAVMLRNVIERRGELGLMRAVGFSHAALARIILVENAALVLAGALIGSLSAMLAVAPNVASNAAAIPWRSIMFLIVAVVVVGVVAGSAALGPAIRTPLLPALRSE